MMSLSLPPPPPSPPPPPQCIHGYFKLNWLPNKDILTDVLLNNPETEMFYLTTHSTHFIYGYMASDIIVEDHSDSEKENPLPPHKLLFLINSKGSFICTIPQTG